MVNKLIGSIIKYSSNVVTFCQVRVLIFANRKRTDGLDCLEYLCLGATYDTLPSPSNLKRWKIKDDDECYLCWENKTASCNTEPDRLLLNDAEHKNKIT